MRRALVLSVLLGALLLFATKAHATWRSKTCRFSGDVKRTIWCATNHWSVPGGVSKALRVARCESGLRAHAYYLGNLGLYQLRYWPARRSAYNAAVGERLEALAPWWNARANALVAIRYAHLYGWEAWSCPWKSSVRCV